MSAGAAAIRLGQKPASARPATLIGNRLSLPSTRCRAWTPRWSPPSTASLALNGPAADPLQHRRDSRRQLRSNSSGSNSQSVSQVWQRPGRSALVCGIYTARPLKLYVALPGFETAHTLHVGQITLRYCTATLQNALVAEQSDASFIAL